MIKSLYLKFTLFLLIISIATKAAILITVNSPTTGRYNDNLSVSVYISSTYSINIVNAAVGNKSVSLQRDNSTGFYNGTIILSSFNQGQLQLNISVTDVFGNIQTQSQSFTFDSLPTVNVIYPLKYASYQQSNVRVKATVSDVGNANCIGKITFSNRTYSFVNSIDTIIDVLASGASSGMANIYFTAVDNAKQSSNATIVPVYCDESAFLKPYFTNTGRMIDFKGNRALILDQGTDNIPHLKIVNIGDGTTETIDLGNNITADSYVFGILSDNGAGLIISYSGSTLTDSVYVWKSGNLNNLSRSVNSSSAVSYGLIARGNYMLWYGYKNFGPVLYLTDLGSLTTKLIDVSILNNNNDLSADGSIAYSFNNGGGYNIKKYTISNGVTQLLTNSDNNIYPSVDNNNVIYLHKDNSTGPYSVHFYDGTTDTNLGSVNDNLNSTTGSKKYQLYGGYAFFGKLDNNGIEQVWTRSPAGVLKQQSFTGSFSVVDKLGTNGRVMFSSNGSRYYADSLTAFKAVQSYLGTVYFVNNDFYVAIGGSIYKFNIPTATQPATLTSFSPAIAATGTIVTLNGTNFTNVTAVSFGGMAAASFKAVSDTVLTAVVGNGASGALAITTPGGTVNLPNFVYLPPPVISAVSQLTSTSGASIIITGTNLTGATAVSFGGILAASFTVNNANSITAKIGVGATGAVTVVTPGGTANRPGFVFVPVPTIVPAGTTNLQSGGSVILTANPSTGYTYQWLKDSVNISGATSASYTATQSGLYTVKITLNTVSQLSAATPVSVTFSLPNGNFKITNTGATCKGSANGTINITALQSLNYTATITNNSNINTAYPFSNSIDINNLPAGTYSICLTVAGQAGYQQCFTSVITEPKDLSLYATILPATKQATLSLSGADTYYITLNGISTTTTASQLLLSLKIGNNTIAVTSNIACQGVVYKNIFVANGVAVFPNPFISSINLNLGDATVKLAVITVYNTFSKKVFSQQYFNQSGIIPLDLSALTPGLYFIKLEADGKKSTYNILKN